MISKGYVGLFAQPFSRESVQGLVSSWLEGGFKVEQVCPGPHAGNTTLAIKDSGELLWEPNLQFRVLNEVTFSWVYLTLGKRVMETSGIPEEGNLLPLEVLADLPGLDEVIDLVNERRLNQLEAEGIL